MNTRHATPAIALAAALGLLLGAAAHAATPAAAPAAEKPASHAATKKPRSAQQEKMANCSKQAKGKKGDERRAFMSSCLSNAPAASAAK